MPIRDNREYRDTQKLEVRKEDAETSYNVEGYASTFKDYLLYSANGVDCYERIMPHAFDETDMTDVIFQRDHAGTVLARTRNNTIKLSIDDHGLKVEADLSKTEASRQMADEIRAGMYDRMSFAFTVDDDELIKESNEKYIRCVKRIGKLYDVSAVSFPANPDTDINLSLRNRLNGYIEAQQELAEIIEKVEEVKEERDISDYTMAEIEERLANLPNDADGREILEERKKELESFEMRQANAKALNNGIIHAEVVERDKKMEEIRTFAPDSKEYRDAYIKQLQGKAMSLEERAALTSAANVIPTETLNKIYGKLEENPLIGELDALHIPGYLSVPVATTVNDAAWTAMGTAATDSVDVVGTVALTAKKLIKTIEITADIAAMAIPAFEGWLVNKLAQKMNAAICAAVVNGSGSNTVPQGIGQCGITVSTALSSPALADFASFMSGVGTAYQRTAVWIMSPTTFFTKVLPLANDSNGMVVMNGINYMLLGHKVVLDGNVDGCKFKSGSNQEGSNANHIIFGSLKEGYIFNYGEGINIEADQSVAFRSGSTVYRAMALCDGAVVDKEAFAWATIA